MPYTDAKLPFSGITPHARHSSYLGARDATERATGQRAAYLALLKAHPEGLTDWESAKLLGWERTTVNARRVPLVIDGLVYSDGWRRNQDTGIRNTVWRIAANT